MDEIPSNITKPDEIERYLVDQAKKRAKEIAEERKKDTYFAELYQKAAKDTGEGLDSTDDLIKRLAHFASPRLKGQLNVSSRHAPNREGKKRTRYTIGSNAQMENEIRKRREAGESVLSLSKQYGIAQPTVKRIAAGR